MQQIGDVHFGAVSLRSTALASLLLRTVLDYCRIFALSSFILCIDLPKAFDFAVREVVMGWVQNAPTDASERRARLLKVGIPDDAVDDLMYWLEMNGPLLRQTGVSGDVAQLGCSLHTAAWFQLPGDTHTITTLTEGRQGCKLGALVFNLIYSVVCKRLRARLRELGAVLVVRHVGGMAFWGTDTAATVSWPAASAEPDKNEPADPTESTDVFEVTYVDDEIAIILDELITVFRSFGFLINWSAGKTEGFVTFRGKDAAMQKRMLFIGMSSKNLLPPDAGAEHLRLV